MNIEHTQFAEHPEKITEAAYDCIWIELDASDAVEGLKSRALQWIDWKLQGQLSRFLAVPQDKKRTGVTFVPTMKRLPSPYLALLLPGDAASGWESFRKNCEGLQLRNVLYFCESPGRLETRLRELRETAAGADSFPEKVTFATGGEAR